MNLFNRLYNIFLDTRNERLIAEMTGYFSGDPKRIQHFIKVYTFAKTIAKIELLDGYTADILYTAAIVHDIGIKPAEEKYGKGVCGGDLQQELGTEPARTMLSELGYSKKCIERVCFLIAHHHTYTGVEGLDWQILIEADFLANAYEDGLSKENVIKFRDKVFRTDSGIRLLNDMFGLKQQL